MPDWRDAAAYAPLLGAERALFAWEWLRRDPLYVAVAADCSRERLCDTDGSAARFGLVAFERPELAVPEARPLWTAAVHPLVLRVGRGRSAAPGDAVEIERLTPFATLEPGRHRDHLLLSDGFHTVRLDGPAGLLRERAPCLCYHLEGLASAKRALLALQRFLALCSGGRFSSALHPREARARRWVLMLRVSDAMSEGAAQREIARELFSNSVAQPRWRTRESSVRAQVQRVVRRAREMRRGDYRRLLL